MNPQIIASIGPQSQSSTVLQDMYQAGASIFRLNMSHGSSGWNSEIIQKIKNNTDALVMLDTKGPEIRTCHVEYDLHLLEGETLVIINEHQERSHFEPHKTLMVTYNKINQVVIKGGDIIIDSGNIVVKVTDITPNAVITEVIKGGKVTSRRHVNLPGTIIDLPILTDNDLKNILIGLDHNIDKIALSFTRNAQDIKNAKTMIGDHNSNIKFIAKIENQEGIDNLDEICQEADEVMIARGDLGVEIPWHTLAIVEENIMKTCQKHNTPVIVATQMMMSMVENSHPTRAEIIDVSFASKLGADFLMLSDETTIGKYPVETVSKMKQIADYARQFRSL